MRYEGLKSSRFVWRRVLEKQVAASNDVKAWPGHARQRKRAANSDSRISISIRIRIGIGIRIAQSEREMQEAGGKRTMKQRLEENRVESGGAN